MEPPRDETTRPDDATRISPAVGASRGPEGPSDPGGPGGPGVTFNWPTGARLPVPGNAEWALWFVVELVFAIIWAASDAVDAGGFVTASAAITFAYLISRGIAKASRVLEQ